MLKIIRVGALDDNKLDIELSNGSLILLDLKKLVDDPLFAVLKEDDRIRYPKTDGDRIYWRDGPSVTVEEMMKLLETP